MTTLAEVIQTVYAYATWANNRVLDAAECIAPEQLVADRTGGFGSIRDTLVHTMSAHRNWLARCQEAAPATPFDPAQFPDLSSIRAEWATLDRATETFLTGLSDDDWGRVISYQNSSGDTYAHPRWQMLMHQANHQMQHRSEVAMALTDLGHSPGWIDLVVFLREREREPV
jgi:uncharacterized damage-inducible protein DinB